MGLAFNIQNERFEISTVRLVASEGVFYADFGKGSLLFRYPHEEEKKYNKTREDFIIFLFHKELFAENDVFAVEIEGQKIGWIFPISALENSDHDNAHNEHFLPYAQNAFIKLLLGEDGIPHTEPSFNEFQMPMLEDFYGANTIALLLYKEQLAKISNFHISNYLVHLFRKGYTLLTSDNFLKLQSIAEHHPLEVNESKIIKLKPLPVALSQEATFINLVFQGIYRTEKNPLVKFHFLYQIIELFISIIFEHEFRRILPTISVAKDFFDAREKLTSLTNEKSRINKLFDQYSKCENSRNLANSCRLLLSVIGVSTDSSNEAELLYKVRSLIFHNYRHIPHDKTTLLDDINNDLEDSVTSLLLNFRIID